mmetsp:Transcript_3636/g.6827  ORF Transcript_3636/g.6827 Transcript_3636/m.6827 type:complete len:221 (+) Transcript_3636:493-1155(+)
MLLRRLPATTLLLLLPISFLVSDLTVSAASSFVGLFSFFVSSWPTTLPILPISFFASFTSFFTSIISFTLFFTSFTSFASFTSLLLPISFVSLSSCFAILTSLTTFMSLTSLTSLTSFTSFTSLASFFILSSTTNSFSFFANIIFFASDAASRWTDSLTCSIFNNLLSLLSKSFLCLSASASSSSLPASFLFLLPRNHPFFLHFFSFPSLSFLLSLFSFP